MCISIACALFGFQGCNSQKSHQGEAFLSHFKLKEKRCYYKVPSWSLLE